MGRRNAWYQQPERAAGMRRSVTEIPETVPVDSPTERFDYFGRELLISCRRGLWEAILRESPKCCSFWYADSKAELLSIFGQRTRWTDCPAPWPDSGGPRESSEGAAASR